ncbi:hypothetical protein OOT00_03235 [Desulfobotulus sp. H1]|uniref:OsmC family peroxiredoxin n=1 Tax=Desulfobotulus pelophilus TaxID=2823377 RepID=A0ABT3N6A3_9BACT|nr:hypothetical protein [Desulfobotulus pelophilus]MCW7752995.1 hypothetical protein [Desulfobotulus pelophilus]
MSAKPFQVWHKKQIALLWPLPGVATLECMSVTVVGKLAMAAGLDPLMAEDALQIAMSEYFDGVVEKRGCFFAPRICLLLKLHAVSAYKFSSLILVTIRVSPSVSLQDTVKKLKRFIVKNWLPPIRIESSSKSVSIHY